MSTQTCTLHGSQLVEGVAALRYDMFDGRAEYFRDCEQFPNAHSFKLYGAGGRPKERRVSVLYCPKCRESERLWYGHMRDMNPDAMKEHHRQKLIDTAWNIVAFFVVVAVIGGSAILRTMP